MSKPTPEDVDRTLNARRVSDRDGEPVYVVMFGTARASAQDMVGAFRRVADILRRRYNVPSALNRLWGASGLKNPLRVEGSGNAGDAVALRMTKTEPRSRAAAAGRALAHGDPDARDPGRGRIVIRQLQRLQAAKRTRLK